MKTFWKTVFRMFATNKGRFIANFLIVLLSIAISAGLAALPKEYTDSYSLNYTENNVPDIILKEKTGNGFDDDDIALVKQDSTVKDIQTFMSMDYELNENIYRIYIMDLHSDIAKLNLVSGAFPSTEIDTNKPIPVMVEEANLNRKSYEVGETVTLNMDLLTVAGLDGIEFTISGIVNSPMYNSVQKENASVTDSNGDVIEDKYVDYILYLDSTLLPETIDYDGVDYYLSSFLVQTDMYIVYQGEKNYFTSAYEEQMEKKADALVDSFGEDHVAALTLEENISYALYKNYNGKVGKIAYVFPAFFVLVCALVNLITITRLIQDERSMIATYLSLGVSKGKVIIKYALFTIISALLGAVVGLALGIPLVPIVVLPAYQAVFEMGGIVSGWGSWYGYFCAGFIVAVSLAVTIGSTVSYLKESPASLMKAKAPKPGKKIFLQSIPILWNHLSFRFKSSFRNIFRQKKNLILTGLSIIGSTLLVLVSFSLLDVSNALKNDEIYANVASSMGTISSVIILFAVSMAIVVVYSLANMNISDRQRELATLKVLGYHDGECSMYTFREIMIVSVCSVIIGLPISVGIIAFVFNYLEFGSIADVGWYSYIYTVLIVLGTTLLVNLFLYPKIKAVDMNDSLKTLD